MLSESEPRNTTSELPAIEVEGLSVSYRAAIEHKQTLKSALVRFGRRQRSIEFIEALQGIDFKVERQSLLGVIGANGAGKSTMLRTVAGILPPTTGKVTVRGRTTTLLATGVGFNGQLSGRENITLGGLAIGLRPDEIEEQIDQVIEFASIGKFIDMPTKVYSSGMFGRLAFSVAVHMKPEILLVDEALSAGDAAFREKASAKMSSLLEEAEAILLVTHGMATIKELATHCLWLHRGKVMGYGDPDAIVAEYTEFVKAGHAAAVWDEI